MIWSNFSRVRFAKFTGQAKATCLGFAKLFLKLGLPNGLLGKIFEAIPRYLKPLKKNIITLKKTL